ncbi:hypothetical protein ACFQVC_10700 [Streptomyces monticola]|uniref:Uncharacterized protein n=1 Tax=Streptomyces monticola TaxID=2666263 RepID=A0ABW2JF58_9ACTN
MNVALAAVASTACVYGMRAVLVWITGRTQVQLARIARQGTIEQVRALPPGSRLSERRRGGEGDGVLVIETGVIETGDVETGDVVPGHRAHA